MSTGEEGMTPTPMEEEKVPPESPENPDLRTGLRSMKQKLDAHPITQSEMPPVPSITQIILMNIRLDLVMMIIRRKNKN